MGCAASPSEKELYGWSRACTGFHAGIAVRHGRCPHIGGQFQDVSLHASAPQTALRAVWRPKESNFCQKSVLRRLHDWQISMPQRHEYHWTRSIASSAVSTATVVNNNHSM